MAQIYLITNKLNQKQYVGKTNFTAQKRWKEHLAEATRKRTQHRPLYNAMNKYGVENFSMRVLETCSKDQAPEREKYWIEKLGTYKNGYNATIGGDGKTFLDYKKILNLFDSTQLTQKEIADRCNCCSDSVKNIVSQYRDNVDWTDRQNYKKIHAYSSLGVIVRSVLCEETQEIFNSCSDAARWLISENKTPTIGAKNHIAECARGVRKTAYGFHWKYIE